MSSVGAKAAFHLICICVATATWKSVIWLEADRLSRGRVTGQMGSRSNERHLLVN